MSNLEGKVAIVTGGNSGIGPAAAQLFATEGAKLVMTGRRQDVLDAAVRSIGKSAIGVQGDVADPAHHAQVAELVRDRFGGADIYMANAGVNTITPSQHMHRASFVEAVASASPLGSLGPPRSLPVRRFSSLPMPAVSSRVSIFVSMAAWLCCS